MKQIIINSEELQTRVAVVNDGVLQDFFMERTARDNVVGSIFKGKIKNMEPSLQAAFVDIGGSRNAFLHYWDMLPASRDTLEAEAIPEEREVADESQLRQSMRMPEQKRGLLSRLKSFFVGGRPEVEAPPEMVQLPVEPRRPGRNRRRQQSVCHMHKCSLPYCPLFTV